jgi:TonB family protein
MNTTILEQRQTSLKTGFSTGIGNRPAPRVILKPAPGKPGGTARLALLPTGNSRWGSLGASITFQILFVATLLIIPLAFPQKMIPKTLFEVIPLATPMTEVPVPPKPVAVKQPKPEPIPVEAAVVPEPVRQPKLLAPKVVAPKVQPKQIATEAPKLDPVFETPKVDVNVNLGAPARPRPPVETGMMNTGSAAPATINKPIDKVQTGGFGDPNGVAGPSDPNKRGNVNARGSFDLPGGPGYGNGTGGANGARGTVASAGFGNGTAIQPTGNGGGGRGTVRSGGFNPVVVEPEKPKAQNNQAAAVQPIEILFKPKAEYTAEAKALKLEGEVIVSVIFKANLEIQVIGVVQGLGHGLDEKAVAVAKQIKFKAAISNGQAVDYPARVRIQFQMAY